MPTQPTQPAQAQHTPGPWMTAPTLYTSEQVADKLSMSIRNVNAKAQRMGIGTKYGQARLFSEAEIEMLRVRKVYTRKAKGVTFQSSEIAQNPPDLAQD